jgi:DNA replication and repair protein RecF
MRLDKIYLKSFRNLEKTELVLGERFNVFYGNNAQGKTNILESIYLLATMKSFKMARNIELITWGSDYSLIKGWVHKDGVAREISLLLEKNGKKAKLDQKLITRLTDFFGHINVIIFSPEEISMVRGLPDLRRRYLDRAVFTSDSTYLALFHDYTKILKNRNTLLKSNDKTGFEIWTDQLIQSGERIMAKRNEYLNDIKGLLQNYHNSISGIDEHVDISYKTLNPHGMTTALAQRSAEEWRRGTTLVGPHRDDVEFTINGRPLKLFGSQGQQRSFVLALKMAEIEHIQQKFDNPPVLLLDDMTSELDQERTVNFMEFLKNRDMQVFITTTDLHSLHLEGCLDKKTFQVINGQIHH